ncbi:unnamed protein product [Parnassius apollo]|uniref:(apollo) hypothetical protein n=1 Tax=Parnassius apollo TaxID=110799 RepID=A0A8S3Y6K8_PARAO|nr:unnamed protein product [Parnassius apollo]
MEKFGKKYQITKNLKEEKESTGKSLIDEFQIKLQEFKRHVYYIKTQYRNYRTCIEEVKVKTLVKIITVNILKKYSSTNLEVHLIKCLYIVELYTSEGQRRNRGIIILHYIRKCYSLLTHAGSEDDIADLEVEERDSIGKNTPRIIKRIRETEESDDEWKIVKGNGKKKRLHEDEKLSTETDIEVYTLHAMKSCPSNLLWHGYSMKMELLT